MISKRRCLVQILFVLSVAVLFIHSFDLYGQGGGAPTIEFGGADSVKDLGLLNKVKDTVLAVLAYIICPVSGVVTAYKGWQMVGNSERGEKGAGAFVLICGILMAVLPILFKQIYGVITKN